VADSGVKPLLPSEVETKVVRQDRLGGNGAPEDHTDISPAFLDRFAASGA